MQFAISGEEYKDETLKDKVVLEVTNYALNRGSKLKPEYGKRRVVFIEGEFVGCFRMHFERDGAFKNINDAFTIYRILKNIDEETYVRAFRSELKKSLANAKEDDQESFVKRQLEDFKQMKVNGKSLLMASADSFLHVPNYDEELANVFPEGVGLSSKKIYNL